LINPSMSSLLMSFIGQSIREQWRDRPAFPGSESQRDGRGEQGKNAI
jgi:hypothetical protein